MNKEKILKKFLKFLWMVWYGYVNIIDKNFEAIFLNYGYANKKKLKLLRKDEKNRYPIQLYNHVACGIKLEDLDVLEIGCGRGGGASYIVRYLNPKKLCGVDLCKKSIDFCNTYYSIKNLHFFHRDALNLLFKNKSFDVVINLESSHSYEDMDKFIKEVYRVLKLNGYFLFADFRNKKDINNLRKKLKNSHFNILKEEKITSNVVRALNLDNKRRLDLINRLVPNFLHWPMKIFAGTKGSKTYKEFVTGKKEYYYFVLKKEI